ncbi:hypothetical protein GVAV_002149 [Gurleya vavrai]
MLKKTSYISLIILLNIVLSREGRGNFEFNASDCHSSNRERYSSEYELSDYNPHCDRSERFQRRCMPCPPRRFEPCLPHRQNRHDPCKEISFFSCDSRRSVSNRSFSKKDKGRRVLRLLHCLFAEKSEKLHALFHKLSNRYVLEVSKLFLSNYLQIEKAVIKANQQLVREINNLLERSNTQTKVRVVNRIRLANNDIRNGIDRFMIAAALEINELVKELGRQPPQVVVQTVKNFEAPCGLLPQINKILARLFNDSNELVRNVSSSETEDVKDLLDRESNDLRRKVFVAIDNTNQNMIENVRRVLITEFKNFFFSFERFINQLWHGTFSIFSGYGRNVQRLVIRALNCKGNRRTDESVRNYCLPARNVMFNSFVNHDSMENKEIPHLVAPDYNDSSDFVEASS